MGGNKADLLIYGMGEKPIKAIAEHFRCYQSVPTHIPQTAYLSDETPQADNLIVLHSYEECVCSKRMQAENFRKIWYAYLFGGLNPCFSGRWSRRT